MLGEAVGFLKLCAADARRWAGELGTGVEAVWLTRPQSLPEFVERAKRGENGLYSGHLAVNPAARCARNVLNRGVFDYKGRVAAALMLESMV